MMHNHTPFAAANASRAYSGDVADRIRRFLPMVRRLAWHVHGSGRPGMEIDDLIQAGLVALTECSQRHASESEDGFAAYAKMRVRGAMIDQLRRDSVMTRGAVQRLRAIRDAEVTLRQQLGRAPSHDELAGAMNVTIGQYHQMRAETAQISVESIDDAYSDSEIGFAADTPDALAMLEDSEIKQRMASAVAELPERLQLVIQLHFVEELNLTEIAAVLDVSVPRVHQIKAQALSRLKEMIDDGE